MRPDYSKIDADAGEPWDDDAPLGMVAPAVLPATSQADLKVSGRSRVVFISVQSLMYNAL